MLLDANLLLYAVDADAAQHKAAARWLETSLSGHTRVALPWQTIGSFLRISTNARVYQRPLTAGQAWSFMSDWLAIPIVWIPPASQHTAAILADLITSTPATANLVPDAQLAALAIEHGLVVHSCDADFARFPGCRWTDPLTARTRGRRGR